MAQVEIRMPKMGESVAEATILKWLKNVGDIVEADEPIIEIATDKVDSEIPSPASGILTQRLFDEGAVVQVGKIVALLGTEQETSVTPLISLSTKESTKNDNIQIYESTKSEISTNPEKIEISLVENLQTSNIKSRESRDFALLSNQTSNKFFSPLVKNIAKQEGVSIAELETISGTGADGRVTKNDILTYLEKDRRPKTEDRKPSSIFGTPSSNSITGENEIIEMDRMRKLIAEHMVFSKHTSPHVTSYIEADVTNIVFWREKIKNDFEKREKEKLTFTPIFVEAVAKAIKDYPLINVSVDGTKIIVKKNVNIGMATALPSGNLIVPVIKNADRMNLLGLIKTVNDLANRARNNKLLPDDIQDGTFTITNVGTFGNVMGAPIINQPQVAILATGVIKKKPAVIETPQGDTIGIRHFMFLSLSYDHRVVDGALGGSFLRKVANYLEEFKGEL